MSTVKPVRVCAAYPGRPSDSKAPPPPISEAESLCEVFGAMKASKHGKTYRLSRVTCKSCRNHAAKRPQLQGRMAGAVQLDLDVLLPGVISGDPG